MPRKYRCKFCNEWHEESIKTPKGRFCSYEHAISFANREKDKQRGKRIAKAKQSQRKNERTARTNRRELDRHSLKWQHKQTQPVFNRMRVLQEKLWFKENDQDPECISCGKKNMDWCCGHFKTRGSQSNLRYDESNTFLQCNYYCNRSLSGNIHGNKTTRGYIQGLKDRFGNDKAQEIIDYCESNSEPKKWTWQELEGFRAECAARIRELEIKVNE